MAKSEANPEAGYGTLIGGIAGGIIGMFTYLCVQINPSPIGLFITVSLGATIGWRIGAPKTPPEKS